MADHGVFGVNSRSRDCEPPGGGFETILNSISDGVFCVDTEWRITCFNSAAERSTGWPCHEAVGTPCREVLRASICERACALRHTLATRRAVVNMAAHIRDRAGRRVPVTLSTALLRDGGGHVIGGVETFRDLNRVKGLLDLVRATDDVETILTADPQLEETLRVVPVIAASDSTVLIEGESGTGKGLLARELHRHSPRHEAPFVTINCGAIPDQLLESELFGYRAGAFTGAVSDRPGRVAAADGGTLFLDEIGDLPPALQVKILRLLQDRTYEPLGDLRGRTADVRIITATNRDLASLVERGEFRRDLYYRVNVIRVVMPPLRDRPGDIPLLADLVLRRLSATRGKLVDTLSRDALRKLMAHDYPGNVRELENILEHAHVLCAGSVIRLTDLPEWLQKSPTGRGSSEAPRTLAEVEAAFIRQVLARHGWHRAAAARELHMHVTTLHRKVHRLGIELPAIDGRSTRRKREARA